MGSAIFNYVISVYGTEKDFMQAVIDQLVTSDSKITCSSDIDDEFDTSDPDHVPTFNFLIDGNLTFTLTRYYNNSPAKISAEAHDYVVSCGDAGSTIGFFNSWQPASAAAITTRAFSFSKIFTDGLTLVSLFSGSSNINIVYTASNSKYYSAINTQLLYEKAVIFNIATRTFTESGTSTTGTLLSRFQYTAPPGYIDYIRSSICQNNNIKVFEFTGICDSTTVTIGDTVSLKDGPYLAVGPHQLVKL